MEVDDRLDDGAPAPVHPDLQGCAPDGGCDEAVQPVLPDDALHGGGLHDGDLTPVESPAHSSFDMVEKSCGRNKTHRRRRLRRLAKEKKDKKNDYTSEDTFSERMKRSFRHNKNKKRNNIIVDQLEEE